MGLITELMDAMRHRRRAQQAISLYEQGRADKLAKDRKDKDEKTMDDAIRIMGSLPDYTSLLSGLRREAGE